MNNKYDRIVIDGNNFLFRAFYSRRPERLVNGFDVSNISHFLNMLRTLQKRFRADEILLTWDKKINSTKENFRKALVKYKGQRVETDITKKIFDNIEHIQKFVDALGIRTLYPVNLEADDVIRFLSTLDGYKKTLIVSSDKDLLQLVNENTHVFMPVKDVIVNLQNFESFAGVEKKDFLMFKCMVGDVSDNVPGLDQIGPIRAKKLIEKLSEENVDITTVLTEEQRNIIERNKSIMDLSMVDSLCADEYGFYTQQMETSRKDFDESKLRSLFREYKFASFERLMLEWNRDFNKNNVEDDLLSMICM
jgi:DNA polymerase I